MQFSPNTRKSLNWQKSVCWKDQISIQTLLYLKCFLPEEQIVGVTARLGHSRTSYAYDWKESFRSTESGTAMFTEYVFRLRIRHLQLLVKEKHQEICLRFSSELFLLYNQSI